MEPSDEFTMNQVKNRLVTFSDWPYDHGDCVCTSEKMAEAGFFHIPSDSEPDLVRCFVCLKELDGWEPQDDPYAEHKKHSPKCQFIKMNKKEADWTIEDLLKMEIKRQQARIEKLCTLKIDEFRQQADEVRERLEEM